MPLRPRWALRAGASTMRTNAADAIAAVEGRQAEALIVAKLERLSRSVADVSALLDRASRARWQIISADLAVISPLRLVRPQRP